tara:strand:- start:633 stop:1097 length:465 start_codon:yes stop_codon:yes gene_type:complete
MLLPISLLLVCIIGFLAQSIGLCMVRDVNEFKRGKPEFLLALLLSGVLAWIAMIYANYFGINTNFKTYEANSWFAIGGVIFGFGTAFNQGCGVSTLSKLSRGDSKIIFTILGWLDNFGTMASFHQSYKTVLIYQYNISHTCFYFCSVVSLGFYW